MYIYNKKLITENILKKFKAEKEQRRLLEIKRVQTIKNDILIINKRADDLSTKSYNSRNKQKLNDNKCPHCHSVNVNERVKKIKCNDCGHEWTKYNFNYYSNSEVIKDKLNDVRYILQEYKKLKECEYDPTDVNEKFNSFEEKQQILKNLLKNIGQ